MRDHLADGSKGGDTSLEILSYTCTIEITLEKTVSTWNMLCQFTSNVGMYRLYCL